MAVRCWGQQFNEAPACRYITDMLRLTVSAANPYLLYLFYELLHHIPSFKVVEVKNKYSAAHFETSGSPSILLKIAVMHDDGSRTICEIQLYIDDFLSLKKMAHKVYEIERVTRVDGDYAPLLKP